MKMAVVAGVRKEQPAGPSETIHQTEFLIFMFTYIPGGEKHTDLCRIIIQSTCVKMKLNVLNTYFCDFLWGC